MRAARQWGDGLWQSSVVEGASGAGAPEAAWVGRWRRAGRGVVWLCWSRDGMCFETKPPPHKPRREHFRQVLTEHFASAPSVQEPSSGRAVRAVEGPVLPQPAQQSAWHGIRSWCFARWMRWDVARPRFILRGLKKPTRSIRDSKSRRRRRSRWSIMTWTQPWCASSNSIDFG